MNVDEKLRHRQDRNLPEDLLFLVGLGNYSPYGLTSCTRHLASTGQPPNMGSILM